MTEVAITPDLVGRKVANPARPEWGDGTVLRVVSTVVEGKPVHRVSVQFRAGHRTVVVPPGRLVVPASEPERAASWIDRAGRNTLDDRLVAIPEAVREFLGTSAQRVVVLSRLYEVAGDADGIVRWARSQTGVADPLAHWTRDELRAAFDAFCRRRDAMLRETIDRLKTTGGPRAVLDAMADVPAAARNAIAAVIG